MSEEKSTLLEVKNLSFSYQPGEEILKGISLTFDQRPTAIVGQNGAGKTTFIKLLKGLLRPIEGTILFKETDLNALTVAQIAKEIGMVFQNPNDQIFKNTVLDEVMFGPLQIGMTKEIARNQAVDALKLFDLETLMHENPYDLLLSERKLVAIASVVAMDTKIIILDEPTIAQDYYGKELIKKAIAKLQADGKLVITIIHDMDFVAEAFERVIVFAQGNILLDGDVHDVFLEEEKLKEAYLEQPHLVKICKYLGFDMCLNLEEFVNLAKERQNQINEMNKRD